jgi:hypothetical protein
MLILNDAQAAIVESLLTKMLIRDSYSVANSKKRSAGFSTRAIPFRERFAVGFLSL